eukprot:m.40160 g.40160  ORF g.40160 m.40160 type:complete len:404 (+) comp9634_c0_seq1:195-1406(+)
MVLLYSLIVLCTLPCLKAQTSCDCSDVVGDARVVCEQSCEVRLHHDQVVDVQIAQLENDKVKECLTDITEGNVVDFRDTNDVLDKATCRENVNIFYSSLASACSKCSVASCKNFLNSLPNTVLQPDECPWIPASQDSLSKVETLFQCLEGETLTSDDEYVAYRAFTDVQDLDKVLLFSADGLRMAAWQIAVQCSFKDITLELPSKAYISMISSLNKWEQTYLNCDNSRTVSNVDTGQERGGGDPKTGSVDTTIAAEPSIDDDDATVTVDPDVTYFVEGQTKARSKGNCGLAGCGPPPQENDPEVTAVGQSEDVSTVVTPVVPATTIPPVGITDGNVTENSDALEKAGGSESSSTESRCTLLELEAGDYTAVNKVQQETADSGAALFFSHLPTVFTIFVFLFLV